MLIRSLFFILWGFLSGSVMFGYLLPKWLKKVDTIAQSEDHNPGTFNAMKLAGTPVGILCLLCDVGKGFIPLFFACRCLTADAPLFPFVLAAPVIGHAFSPWLRGQGGKAIAVTFGVLLGLVPFHYSVLLLAISYLFFSLIIVIYPHNIRTVWAFIVFCGANLFLSSNRMVTFGCFIISGIVIMKHLCPSQGGITMWTLLGKKVILKFGEELHVHKETQQ